MPDAHPRRQRILIVDDEEDILESLRDLFQATLGDVDCLVAPDGPSALELLGREQVDLIISDHKMPGMNGLQFMEKARQQAPHVPRIMMTAYPDADVAIQAINEARIVSFFTKPLEPDKLIDMVRSILQEARSGAAQGGD